MDLTALVQGRRSKPRPMAARSLLCLVATALLLVPAQAQKATEYEVKAAYLFNFGKFLRQPDAPDATARRNSFDICVLGRNDFGAVLEKLTANEQVNGLPERTLKVPSAVAARSCAILFISSSEADHIDQDVTDLAGAPVLTVSDIPHFLDHGGMIEFEMQANHVRFSVGLDAVTRAGLGLSSELLKVSLQVTGAPKRGTP
jgi:hypothetical protein